MEIISILGSPRESGNSALLAGIITSILEKRGHHIQTFVLNTLNMKGCQACGACKGKSEICILKDDLTPVLQAVIKADVIILATPVYWGDVSAQLKMFIDRTYSFLTPDFMTQEIKHRLPEGKKLVFIQTQGAGQELYDDVFDRYNSFFKKLNFFEKTYVLRGCELNERGEASRREDLVGRAEEIAERL